MDNTSPMGGSLASGVHPNPAYSNPTANPAGTRVESAAQTARQATDKIADKASGEVDRLSGTAHRAVDSAAGAASSAAEWASSIPEQAKQAQALEAQTLHPACYILLSALVRSSALGARQPAMPRRPCSGGLNSLYSDEDIFDMRLRDPDSHTVCSERDVYTDLLPLAGARVAELGCGRAELTRAIAEEFPTAQIIALEVDTIQHARNLVITDLPNVRFVAGGAEALPLDDDSVDLVLMFKSLHHVPGDLLDTALAEVRRVLAPGGLAYISEPVFAGEYNEIMRIFHDEERVRAAAFAAITRSVESGTLEFVTERFFNTPLRFDDFAHFEERVLGVTHTQHRLSESQLSAVRERFMRHLTPQGVKFLQPMRVDLLRKPASVALATPGF